MKTLDVQAFHNGIDETLTALKHQTEEIKRVKESIKGITSLDDALKGKGGEAIRSFYEECHITFLLFYESFISDYKGILEKMKSALENLEPTENGLISQNFLEHELIDGISKAESLTAKLTDKANQTAQTVSHIANLPALDDTAVHENTKKAERQINETIEKLHTFDREQAAALTTAEQDLTTMKQYIDQLKQMYTGPKIEISTYQSGAIFEPQPTSVVNQATPEFQSKLQNPDKTPIGKMLKRFSEKDEKGKVDDVTKEELPFEIDWMYPIGSAGSAYGTATAVKDFGTSVKHVTKDGVSIKKTKKTLKNGQTIRGYKVENGKVINIKGKNYPDSWTNSQLKAGHTPEIARQTKVPSAVKGAMKSKLGWAGVAITTGEDLINNINDPNASVEKTVGDVGVDVGIGAVTLGVGAGVGALFVGTVGLPVVAAAGIGFIASIGVSELLGGFKWGKDKKSVTDMAKDTVESGLKTVAGWFK
ncbi:LXG domain-containing protein [Bacillus vallismortis]|uniref:LXG domain-containing protein n=1 Tax=Bacillus vallismortis TaxID=72361 RepID=UPI001F511454|nr:LXG domain-containing protein [Bacillus vallismortis]MEC1268239.1 LXG domain-containing protein [Bacillus vallismortis]